MKYKSKKTTALIAVLLCVAAALIIFGWMTILDYKRMPIPDNPVEAFIDEFVGQFVDSGYQDIPRQNLIESEDSAKEYARVLWKENYEYYEHWNENYEIWVKHYKEQGVWIAMWGSLNDEMLTGPPWIIFQDKDGKVIRYVN